MVFVVRNTSSIASRSTWTSFAIAKIGLFDLAIVSSLGALTRLVLSGWTVMANGAFVEIGRRDANDAVVSFDTVDAVVG